jgi:hypothetical protein
MDGLTNPRKRLVITPAEEGASNRREEARVGYGRIKRFFGVESRNRAHRNCY